MWKDVIDLPYLMVKNRGSEGGGGHSVRREGECISGWDRLKDRRGDSKGYQLSSCGCVADMVISHVYTLVIHAAQTPPLSLAGLDLLQNDSRISCGRASHVLL